MFSSVVSAIRPDSEYTPGRSLGDSADINQGELIGSSASFRAVLKRVKIVAANSQRRGLRFWKWQAGAAGLVVAPHSWGILALVVTYQHSFSGNSSSPVGQLASVQPFVIRNLHRGFYLRSSGAWTFDTFHHVKDIPLGFGVGKVLKDSNGDIANFYIEPQYSVFQSGVGSPKWQVFAGTTFKFPTGKRQMER